MKSLYELHFFFCLLVLTSCGGRTDKSIANVSICVNPIISHGCLEVNGNEIFYSDGTDSIDSLNNFESIKVSKITRDEFREIANLVLSSDLIKGKRGEYMIDEKRFCINIEYADGSQQSFEKVSLTSKDYQAFEGLMHFTSPISKNNIEYKIKAINCAINSVPSKIQRPMEILIPVDTID